MVKIYNIRLRVKSSCPNSIKPFWSNALTFLGEIDRFIIEHYFSWVHKNGPAYQKWEEIYSKFFL
jgi:hypothetical protein